MSQDAPHHQLGRAGAGSPLGAALIVFWLRFGAGLVLFGLVVLVAIVGSLPLIAVLALVVFAIVETTCCTWVAGHWDEWDAVVGAKLRAQVDGWHEGRIMGPVAEGLGRGSAVWSSVAAALAGSVDAVSAERLLTGRSVPRPRVVWSCVVRASFLTVLFVLIALLVGPGGTRF